MKDNFDPEVTLKQNSINSNASDFWISATELLAGKKKKFPAQWAPFFTSLLLSPSNYSWAKKFIESDAWDIFSKNLTSVSIRVPDQCPLQNLICPHEQSISALSLPNPDHSETLVMEKNSMRKAKKTRIAVVESEVRRSPRLKENNKGFKANTCTGKKCLACSPSPPDLSLDMIKSFGSSYCQIEEELLTEKALNNNNNKKPIKAVTKKLLKENKDPVDEDPPADQDEDGVNPPAPVGKKEGKQVDQYESAKA